MQGVMDIKNAGKITYYVTSLCASATQVVGVVFIDETNYVLLDQLKKREVLCAG